MTEVPQELPAERVFLEPEGPAGHVEEDPLTLERGKRTAISRRKFLAAAGLGTGALVLVCSGLAGLLGLGSKVVEQQSSPFSDQFNKLMEDSRVKQAIKILGLGNQTPDQIKASQAFLSDEDRVTKYLEAGSVEQWSGLSSDLNTQGPNVFFAHMTALQGAGCLDAKTKTLIASQCDINHPGFRSLTQTVKDNYVKTFNGKLEELKTNPQYQNFFNP